MTYQTRQDVADIIAVKGGVWEALNNGYLKYEDMPDYATAEGVNRLDRVAMEFSHAEDAFLGLLPEFEYS